LERDLTTSRTHDDGAGVVLRATRRGALVLETVNARRRSPRAERQESDQLPEEGPPGQVPEDEPGSPAREDAEDTPGVPGEEERGTGHDQ
jgi:tRNA G37 N-methylase TrmD